MAKKTVNKFSAENFGSTLQAEKRDDNDFYFGKENYKFMLIGLALIILGFVLMMGGEANTIDGKFDPNSWNEGVFSIVRIRIAPLLVVVGFAVEVYAILKRNK